MIGSGVKPPARVKSAKAGISAGSLKRDGAIDLSPDTSLAIVGRKRKRGNMAKLRGASERLLGTRIGSLF